MYDKVLVITINPYYSKVPSTGTRYFFSTVPVPRYNFSKVPSTGTAVLLKSTVPTYAFHLGIFWSIIFFFTIYELR